MTVRVFRLLEFIQGFFLDKRFVAAAENKIFKVTKFRDLGDQKDQRKYIKHDKCKECSIQKAAIFC